MAQMIPLEDYISQVLEALSPLEDDRLELGRAHGRVLAEDVTAAVPVPRWTATRCARRTRPAPARSRLWFCR